MTARVLTDEEWERHIRIGVALGVTEESLRAESRDRPINMRAVTDIEPCEVCGVPVFAVEEDGVIDVCEPHGRPTNLATGWWHDVITHVCRSVDSHRTAMAEQVTT